MTEEKGVADHNPRHCVSHVGELRLVTRMAKIKTERYMGEEKEQEKHNEKKEKKK